MWLCGAWTRCRQAIKVSDALHRPMPRVGSYARHDAASSCYCYWGTYAAPAGFVVTRVSPLACGAPFQTAHECIAARATRLAGKQCSYSGSITAHPLAVLLHPIPGSAATPSTTSRAGVAAAWRHCPSPFLHPSFALRHTVCIARLAWAGRIAGEAEKRRRWNQGAAEKRGISNRGGSQGSG